MSDFSEISRRVDQIVRHRCAELGQMTLGRFIEALGPLKKDKQLCFDFARLCPTDFDSYRGYYDHLALGFKDDGNTTVGAILESAIAAVNETFSGYKGGNFVMNASTPLWAANWGNGGGSRIVDVEDREYEVVIVTDMAED